MTFGDVRCVVKRNGSPSVAIELHSRGISDEVIVLWGGVAWWRKDLNGRLKTAGISSLSEAAGRVRASVPEEGFGPSGDSRDVLFRRRGSCRRTVVGCWGKRDLLGKAEVGNVLTVDCIYSLTATLPDEGPETAGGRSFRDSSCDGVTHAAMAASFQAGGWCQHEEFE